MEYDAENQALELTVQGLYDDYDPFFTASLVDFMHRESERLQRPLSLQKTLAVGVNKRCWFNCHAIQNCQAIHMPHATVVTRNRGHAEDLDLGDVFANFVAHLRTTDFPAGAAYATMLQNSFDAYNRATWASEACQFACGEGLDTEVDRSTWRAGNVDDGYDDAQDCNWVAEDPEARCDAEGTGIFGTATLEDMSPGL